jgi:hypothetical protein
MATRYKSPLLNGPTDPMKGIFIIALTRHYGIHDDLDVSRQTFGGTSYDLSRLTRGGLAVTARMRRVLSEVGGVRAQHSFLHSTHEGRSGCLRHCAFTEHILFLLLPLPRGGPRYLRYCAHAPSTFCSGRRASTRRYRGPPLRLHTSFLPSFSVGYGMMRVRRSGLFYPG